MLRVFDRQRGHLFNWLPVAYGAGICAYFQLRWEPSALHWGTLTTFLFGTALVLFWSQRARQSPLIIAVLAICLGIVAAGARTAHVAAPKLDYRYYGPIEGRIVAIDRSQSDAVRLTLDRVHLLNIPPEKLPARVRISLHGQQGYLAAVPGLMIAATGHLAPPAGPVEPNGYDFRRQAWFSQIGAVGYTRVPVLAMAPPQQSGLALKLAALRYRISAHVLQAMDPAAAGFAVAITTGDRSAIPRDILDDLRATNLAHLLAISGLHMGLLTGVVFASLRLGFVAIPGIGLRYPVRKWAAVGALCAGAVYLAL